MRSRIRACLAILLPATLSSCGVDVPKAERALPTDWEASRHDLIKFELDTVRGRVWALSGDGVEVFDARTGRRLSSVALPEWIWVHEPYACPPDLTLAARQVLVTSNVVPVIWRVDTVSLAVSRHEIKLVDGKEQEMGFSSLAYVPGFATLVAVSGVDGSRWRIDPALTRAERLPSTEPAGGCGRGGKTG